MEELLKHPVGSLGVAKTLNEEYNGIYSVVKGTTIEVESLQQISSDSSGLDYGTLLVYNAQYSIVQIYVANNNSTLFRIKIKSKGFWSAWKFIAK